MKESSPIPILIILFIMIGLAYSPLKEGSFKRSGSENPQTGTSVIQNSNTETQNYQNQNVVEEIKNSEQTIKELEEDLQKKIEESKRSPFHNKVTMSTILGLHSNDPSEQYLYLYTNLNDNEKINITGWYLKSEVTGYYGVIGKASTLPFPFSRTETDVIIQKGDTVIINKGFSPIGISFRTNRCTGYFEENRTFYPNLSLNCPRPASEKLPMFSSIPDRNDECIDIIERLRRCSTVNSAFLRDLPDTVTSSCKNYMSTQVNYNSCVAKHFGDTDFPGNEYRIFLNKLGALWGQRREKINLHDSNGLIVDTVTH